MLEAEFQNGNPPRNVHCPEGVDPLVRDKFVVNPETAVREYDGLDVRLHSLNVEYVENKNHHRQRDHDPETKVNSQSDSYDSEKRSKKPPHPPALDRDK